MFDITIVSYRFFIVCIAFFCVSLSTVLADKVRILDDPVETIGQRVRLIRKAKKEVFFSSHIFRGGKFSKLIVKELAAAAARDVNVKLQLDGFYTFKMDSSDWKMLYYLQSLGVEIRIYKRIGIYSALSFNRRNHDKIQLVDGFELIVGGRNMWDRPYNLSNDPEFDLDVLIEGRTAAAQAEAYLIGPWNKSTPLRPRQLSQQATKDIILLLQTNYEDLSRNVFMQSFYRLGLSAGALTDVGENVEFIADRRANSNQPTNHIDRIVDWIDSAHQRVVIASPWIVLTKRIKQALQRAQMRNVEITLLTNSHGSSEFDLNFGAFQIFSIPFLVKNGIDVQLLEGDIPFHYKFMILDQAIYIGSYNLGRRSEFSNSETGVWIRNTEITSKLSGFFAEAARNSRPLSKLSESKDILPCFEVWSALRGLLL